MKIILIEAKSPGLHVFSRFKLPRLGLISLGTIARQMGHEVKIYCEDLTTLNWSEIGKAELVGVSSLTLTAPRALEIIKQIKQQRPHLPVIVGGPHFTFLPAEAFQAGADFVIRHEGEETFKELLEWLTNGQGVEKLSEIKGLSYQIAGRYFHNPERPLIQDLDALPFPDFNLVVGKEKIFNVIVQLSRGCPFSCNFCSVIQMFGRGVRVRKNIGGIVDELEKLLRGNKKKFLFFWRKKPVFFYDDNFFIKPEMTKELLREIIKRKIKFKFSAQIRIDAGRDEEFLSLARQAGMDYCYIGYESINPLTQVEYDKKIKIEEMISWTRIIRSHGIRIHGMFVFDGDTDDRQVILETVRFAINNHLDSVQFIILVPLPGTPIFQKLKEEGRIIDLKWEHYDGHHVVFKPKKISEKELFYGTLLQAMPNFYSLWRTIPKIFSMIFHFPFISKFSLKEKLDSFIIHLYGHHLLKRFRKTIK